MVSEAFRQFLIGVAVLLTGAFVVSAVLAPPDPFTMVAVNAALLPLVLVGSYVLAYRRGFEWV